MEISYVGTATLWIFPYSIPFSIEKKIFDLASKKDVTFMDKEVTKKLQKSYI